MTNRQEDDRASVLGWETSLLWDIYIHRERVSGTVEGDNLQNKSGLHTGVREWTKSSI